MKYFVFGFLISVVLTVATHGTRAAATVFWTLFALWIMALVFCLVLALTYWVIGSVLCRR